MKIETALKWYNETVLAICLDTDNAQHRNYVSRLNEVVTCLATYVQNSEEIKGIDLLKTVIEQQNQVIKALTNSRVSEGTYETEV